MIDFSGAFRDANDWNLQARVVHDAPQWGSEKRRLSGISGNLPSPSERPCWKVRLLAMKPAGKISLQWMPGSASGTINAPHVELQAAALPSGDVNAVLDFPLDDLGAARATVAFTDFDLTPVNGLLPFEHRTERHSIGKFERQRF